MISDLDGLLRIKDKNVGILIIFNSSRVVVGLNNRCYL